MPVRVYKHNEYTGTCGRQRALDALELIGFTGNCVSTNINAGNQI